MTGLSNQRQIDDITNFAMDTSDGPGDFVFVYGSHATGDQKPDSDIDLMFVSDEFSHDRFEEIRNFSIDLHQRYGMNLDIEVPLESKLLVARADVQEAANLGAFIVDSAGNFHVAEITDDPVFLASHEAKLRLILNSLTTPNIFIHGDFAGYSELRGLCAQGIARLGISLVGSQKANIGTVQHALIYGGEGESGRQHLGYKPERKKVVEHLAEVLHQSQALCD